MPPTIPVAVGVRMRASGPRIFWSGQNPGVRNPNRRRGSSRIASMGCGGDRKRWGVRSGSSVESSGRHGVRPHLPMLEELVAGGGLRRPDCDLVSPLFCSYARSRICSVSRFLLFSLQLDFDGEASLEQAWRSVQFLFVPVRGWIKLQQ